MYDWANSAYITTFAAIVAAFFTGVIVPEGGFNGFSGQTLWSAVISVGAIVLFLAMPVLGAVADYTSAKKVFLRFFAWFGALTTIAMPFVPSGSVVVPGSLPASDGSHSLACAVIVKRVDAATRAKTSINDLLRA